MLLLFGINRNRKFNFHLKGVKTIVVKTLICILIVCIHRNKKYRKKKKATFNFIIVDISSSLVLKSFVLVLLFFL